MEDGSRLVRLTGLSSLHSPMRSYSRNYRSLQSIPTSPFHKRPKQSVFDILKAQYKAKKSPSACMVFGQSQEVLRLAPSIGVKRPDYVLKYERTLARKKFQVGRLS